jgi:hypothetical protein
MPLGVFTVNNLSIQFALHVGRKILALFADSLDPSPESRCDL